MIGAAEGAMEFRLLAWTDVENTLTVTSDLNVQVYEGLDHAGVRSAVPQRDLHVRSVAPGSALVVDGIAPEHDTRTRN